MVGPYVKICIFCNSVYLWNLMILAFSSFFLFTSHSFFYNLPKKYSKKNLKNIISILVIDVYFRTDLSFNNSPNKEWFLRKFDVWVSRLRRMVICKSMRTCKDMNYGNDASLVNALTQRDLSYLVRINEDKNVERDFHIFKAQFSYSLNWIYGFLHCAIYW